MLEELATVIGQIHFDMAKPDGTKMVIISLGEGVETWVITVPEKHVRRSPLITLATSTSTIEPEFTSTDGTVRKQHYTTDSEGNQPWDVITKVGWGPGFAAGNVLKYLRRNKDVEDSHKKARWYWQELHKLGRSDVPKDRVEGTLALCKLVHILTDDEIVMLKEPIS